MKKNLKSAIVIMLVTGLSLSFMGIVTAEEPIPGEIIVTPEEIIRLSELTFSVEISGEVPEEVRVNVLECNDQLCYTSDQLNESLQLEENTWTGSATLIKSDTTYCEIWLEIKSNGTWYSFSDSFQKFNVSEIPDNGGNGDNGDNGGNGSNGTNGSPGFELALLVVSVIFALSIYKRKKMK